MEEEKKEILEGKIADTSAANPEVEEKVELATDPVPTEEEKVEAGLVEEKPENPDEGLTIEKEEEPKIFTQSQVNDLVGKTRTETRNKTFEYIYGRYGVNDENGLDDLVGNAQRFDSLKEEFDGERSNWENERAARDSEFVELREKVALMESGIDKERYDDAKFILKGKGLEVTAENIAKELESHPEWKKEDRKVYEPKVETSKISVLGNEKVGPEHSESEEDYAMDKLFKVR